MVETLPPAPPESVPEFVDYKEVLATFNPSDIALIKSILDAEKITYFLQGEHFLPLALPARLMVKVDQAEQAREILKDLKLSFLGVNVSKDSEENP